MFKVSDEVKFKVVLNSWVTDTSNLERNLNGAVMTAPFDLEDVKEWDAWFSEHATVKVHFNLFSVVWVEEWDEDDCGEFSEFYSLTPAPEPEMTETEVQENEAESDDDRPRSEGSGVLPDFVEPTNDNDRVITIVYWAEAAHIVVNGEVVYSGNLWDYHAGCVGTVFDGHDVADYWDEGVQSLAAALKLKYLEAGLTAQIHVVNLDDDDEEVFDKILYGED